MQHRPPFPVLNKKGQHKAPESTLRSPILRALVWCAVLVFWYKGEDRRTRHPLLIRTTAHLSVVALALAAIFFGGLEIPGPPAYASTDGLPDVAISSSVARLPEDVLLESAPSSTPRGWPRRMNVDTVSRMPVPYTLIPERPRARVMRYVVRRGETLFDIAARFGLSPATIVWSNHEAFRGVPWFVGAGTELFILPVDGVYHTVRRGETVERIATLYGVDAENLYNEWNDLGRGDRPRRGQRLVVPGGRGEELAWQLPARYATPEFATYRHEACGGEVVIGPGGHGWLTYPTGSSEISGWGFHDPRQWMHGGLDYRCRYGDPIYAADNGTVTVAGWYGTYGIMVEIRHGDGFATRYSHLSSVVVVCGQPVYQGDQIGTCGSTGWSSGAHLHFEIRQDDAPQDPRIYLPPLSMD